jgi:hypothetical protein
MAPLLGVPPAAAGAKGDAPPPPAALLRGGTLGVLAEREEWTVRRAPRALGLPAPRAGGSAEARLRARRAPSRLQPCFARSKALPHPTATLTQTKHHAHARVGRLAVF